MMKILAFSATRLLLSHMERAIAGLQTQESTSSKNSREKIVNIYILN